MAKYSRSVGRSKTADKPAKPYPNYPLSPHPSGAWQKKINGRIHYFGRWGRIRNGKMERLPNDGWKDALAIYKAQADDLHAGRTPRVKSDGLTLADLLNRFLTSKLRKMESDELSPRTFAEYRQTCDRLAAAFGKTRPVDDLAADDFERLRAEMAKRWGPVRVSNEITRVKGVFKYAVDNALIDRPVRFGSEFRKPGKSVMRKHRAESGKKLFTASEIRALLDAASPQLRGAILLGANAGLGNMDVASLREKHLELSIGWLDFARVKTGIDRRCPLWVETVSALRNVLAQRPEPKTEDAMGLVFLTERGTPCVRVTSENRTDYLGREFGKLLKQLDINGRSGLGFYSLRHTFATIGLQTRDRDAVKALMGHSEGDMLAAYDETGPSDDRLRAVTDHVRQWLFAEGERNETRQSD